MLQLCVRRNGKVWFGVAYEEQRVVATTFADDEKKVVRSLLESVPFGKPFEFSLGLSSFAENTVSIMKEVYDGKGTAGDIPLAMDHLPAYTQRVLLTVSQIPVGYVASYGGVAKAAGGGARAVGNAMASNPFAPIVPCHRVVTSNLGLGGYGGGLKTKFDFLKREKRGYVEWQEILSDGKMLRVFPVEFVLSKLEKSAAFKQ